MICEQQFRLKKDGTPYKDCLCRTPELIENYEIAIVDITQTWQCHHRLETHNSDGQRRLVEISSAELIALDMYYDRPPKELIFMTSSDHICLNNLNKERRRHISESLKGRIISEEWKNKISESLKGHPGANRNKKLSEETKNKMSEALKGKHWKLVDGKRVWY